MRHRRAVPAGGLEQRENRGAGRLRSNGYLSATWSGTVAAGRRRRRTACGCSWSPTAGRCSAWASCASVGLERYDEGAVEPVVRTWAGMAGHRADAARGAGPAASTWACSKASSSTSTPTRRRRRPRRCAWSCASSRCRSSPSALGFSDNVGLQLTLEHTHRRVFGTRWIAKNKFELGRQRSLWEGDLISHPLDDGYRNLARRRGRVPASATTRRATRGALRVGRTREDARIWRLYFAEYARARLETSAGVNDSSALSANYHWTWRGVDNLRAPTKGITWALQGGLGYSRGSVTNTAQQTEEGAARSRASTGASARTGRSATAGSAARGSSSARSSCSRR